MFNIKMRKNGTIDKKNGGEITVFTPTAEKTVEKTTKKALADAPTFEDRLEKNIEYNNSVQDIINNL